MTIKKLLFLSISVFLLMGTSLLSASEKVPLRAQDRVEIEQLMWEYIQALDSHDAEAFLSKFTPDGEFRSSASTAKGREALKKMVVDAWKKMDATDKDGKKKPHMYHIVTNPHIEFIDEDHARYHAYWMGVLETGGEVVTAGREVNELVKINGKWLIKIRDVNPGNDGI
ncbi:MAG: nuclear transport factor 2 family protein [Desulfobacteraceae bacterium]|jgi:uncharacterized protein (TIGR02246 family)